MNSMRKLKDGTGAFKNFEDQFNKIFKTILRDGPLSRGTYFRYASSYRVFMKFLADNYHFQKLCKIKDRHVVEFIEWRKLQGIATGTIKRDVVAIRFFHEANDKAENRLRPLERYDFGEIKRKYINRAWTDGEFEGICRKAADLGRQDVLFTVRLARYVGLRVHECLKINTADVASFLKTGQLDIVGKGGKLRTVPLSAEAQNVLAEVAATPLGRRKLLIPPGKKAHEQKQAIRDFIEKHRDKVMAIDREKPISIHGLRHRYAQEERAAGKSLKEVSRLLGHERDEITKVYVGKER